jgi:hypothetical protein
LRFQAVLVCGDLRIAHLLDGLAGELCII